VSIGDGTRSVAAGALGFFWQNSCFGVFCVQLRADAGKAALQESARSAVGEAGA
jgi:hypothetical protein